MSNGFVNRDGDCPEVMKTHTPPVVHRLFQNKNRRISKMKKALSLLLALVMCLALVPMTVSASGITFSFNKTEYDIGEEIVVTVTGINELIAQLKAPYVRLILCKVGTPNSDRIELRERYPGDSETVRFAWTTESGMYEIRLTDSAQNVVYATSAPFPVGFIAGAGNISLDKTAYVAMETITITVSGITEQMVAARAAVYIYEKGAKHEDHSFWAAVPAGSSTQQLNAPNKNGEFEMRLYSNAMIKNDDTFVMSVPFTVFYQTGSDWARGELEKANAYGLIPDMLKGQDFSKPITRREFAAVSVKLYENLTGTKATPAATNPFTDTNDVEVLKAYNVGITAGTAADKFSPDVLLNREQAATMLTRVLKAAYIKSWTLATDNSFTLNFTMPAKFADDDKISDWAKPSVYFMAANGIIMGTGNNMFSPRATTPAEEAALYASATREQALAIAVRIVDKLKDKPLDFKQN